MTGNTIRFKFFSVPLKYTSMNAHQKEDNHTLHHHTHIALTRLASHLTACLHYLLLTVFSFKFLCTQPLLLPIVLECMLGNV
jgi:hypothetical protein